MKDHHIRVITDQDRRAVRSRFAGLRRRHDMAPHEVSQALDHFRQIRTSILDFSHTAVGQRILPSLHLWEMGSGATSKQLETAELMIDRLLVIVAWGHGIKPESIRQLIHEEMELALPSKA